MRHKSNQKSLNRPQNQRGALLRSLAVSLIRDERIVTTRAKARALRPVLEKLVTRARKVEGEKNGTQSYRTLLSRLDNNSRAAKKLVSEIAPRYKDRSGGYTRIVKLPARASDSAEMAVIEFV